MVLSKNHKLDLAFSQTLLDCPSAEELIRFRERKRSRKREEEICFHLAFCKDCNAVLLTARETEVPETVKIPKGLAEKLNQVAREAWEKGTR